LRKTLLALLLLASLASATETAFVDELQLEFLPGEGRSARDFPLYRFPDAPLLYINLWDLSQILQGTTYFDPVTRKALLRVGDHRIKFTDAMPWVFFDGRARELAAPCRIAEGEFYLPLDFWPALIADFPDLSLSLDPDSPRVIAGPGRPNLHSLEWVSSSRRLRMLLTLSGKLEPSSRERKDGSLELLVPGGRLSDFDWSRVPEDGSVDSLVALQDEDSARLLLFPSRPIQNLRERMDSSGKIWVLSMDFSEGGSLPEPALGEALLPGEKPKLRRGGFQVIVLDPGHGGRDTGAISGTLREKDWCLQMAGYLEPFLSEEGFEVLWSRKSDRDIPAGHRVQAANVAGGEFFLSLHWTRRGSEGPVGMEFILQENSGRELPGELVPWQSVQDQHHRASLELALDLQRFLSLEDISRTLGIRSERTLALRGLDMPALLLEVGNLDSAVERAAWEDPPTRKQRLRALARALRIQSRRWEKEGRP
jgi:N-acetylmuramoyl-L-alanine amidase